jgi:hypothetical protein
MKTLRFPLYLAVAAVTFLTACDKDKEKAKPKTKTELLTSNNWIMTARTVNPAARDANGNLITDLFAQMDPCDRDDVWQFATPNAFTLDEGASKCSAGGPQSYPGTWSLGNNESTLTTKVGNGQPDEYNIEELNSNTMKLTETVTSGNGTNYTITTTMAKR